MKNLITLLILFLISISAFAQNGINYKAQISDANGTIMINEDVELAFAIFENGVQSYAESHNTTTNANGIVTLIIGEGVPAAGTFDNIKWQSQNVSLDIFINNGIGFTLLGSSPFNSVPFAHALIDPVFEKDGINAFKETGNIGIGTNDPEQTLHVLGSTRLEGQLMLNTGAVINEFSTATTLGTSDNIVPTQNAVKTYVDTAINGASKTILIPFSAFIGASPTSYNFFGDRYASCSASSLKAPLSLPVGATITNITYYLFDADPSDSIIVQGVLQRYNLSFDNATDQVHNPVSTSINSGIDVFSVSTNEVISENNFYDFTINPIGDDFTSSVGIKGVKVTYIE